jgi:triphosphatase
LPQVLLNELKKLNAVLGPARDWDVFCTETLPPLRAALPDSAPLEDLATQAERARQRAHDVAANYLRSPACGRLLLGLARHLAAGHRRFVAQLGEPGLEEFAARHLKKRHKRVLAMTENSRMTTEERHRLRIGIKRLRYAMECFSSLYPKQSVTRMAAAVTKLQDILGRMNDGAVADRLLLSIANDLAAFQRARDLVNGWQAAIGLKSSQMLGAALQNFSRIKRFW